MREYVAVNAVDRNNYVITKCRTKKSANRLARQYNRYNRHNIVFSGIAYLDSNGQLLTDLIDIMPFPGNVDPDNWTRDENHLAGYIGRDEYLEELGEGADQTCSVDVIEWWANESIRFDSSDHETWDKTFIETLSMYDEIYGPLTHKQKTERHKSELAI